MNLTLHLTDACNLNCAYCVHEKRERFMTADIVRAACKLAFSQGTKAGLCFFGGEPLLCKDLICDALDECRKLEKQTGIPFSSKMTTNGILLDDAFLARAKAENMGIGLSFEGLGQDICRNFADGSGSFDIVSEKAKLLLQYLPFSAALMTIAPQAVSKFAASVRYLCDLGFHNINATIALGKKVNWTDADMAALETQMREIAAYYADCFLKHKPFYFSPFDSKIIECIKGYNPAERCHLGFRQMPVAVDGNIYACTQFIGDADYCIGNAFDGLDKEKQYQIAAKASIPASCKECELRTRCTNSCGCVNRLETGDERKVSPLQCTYERMIISIADELGEQLFAADPDLFRQRYIK